MMEAERVRQYVCSSDTLGITKRARISFGLAGWQPVFGSISHSDSGLTSGAVKNTRQITDIVFILPKLFWHVPFGNGRYRFSLDFRAHLLFMACFSPSYLKWYSLCRGNGEGK
jgi:hypothetical protein